MTAGGDGPGGPDFFISYTQADRAWAEWIGWALEEDGNRVLIQACDFVPGSNWISGMHQGVRGAARTIAVLSDAYLGSVYGGAEWQAAWAADPDGAGRKLLVVRVADCARPGLLAGVASIDLLDLTEEAARSRLREAVRAARTGRAKPTAPPAYPGAARAVPARPEFPARLPEVWQVPPHNPHFTGRGSELAGLARGLGAQSTVVTVQSVHGLGGVGKTQLATEYAHTHASGYDIVWQIHAEEPAALAGQFTALATRLGLEPVADAALLSAQLSDYLRTAGRGWLLIFDNADAVTDIQAWLPGGPLTPGARGHVLITTRRGGFSVLGQVLDLDVVPPADALALLRTRLPALDREIGEAIATELGHLPLALEQAAAYLDITQLPPADYLGLLRTRPGDVHQRGRAGTREETMATLWDLSLDRLTQQHPAARQLADICAYLAPDPIPADLFTSHPDMLPAPLSLAAADPLAFTDTPAPQDPATDPASEPGSRSYPLATALRLLRADSPGQIIGAPEDWPRWAVLLPHVLAATTHNRPTDASTGADHTGWLLDRAGTYLRVHAQLSDARPLQERALAIAEACYGPDHRNVGVALNNLALTLGDLGQPVQARPLQVRALAIDEAVYGPDHPDVARDLNNLAVILLDLGQAGQAQPLHERSLATFEAAKARQHDPPRPRGS